MSVIAPPISQPPFPPGTSPSHYALHQAASPAAQTATPHAVASPYHSNQSYLPQSQVECLASCLSPCCQYHAPCFHRYSTFLQVSWFKMARRQLDSGTLLGTCWRTNKPMRPATFLKPLLKTSSHIVLMIQPDTYTLQPACFGDFTFHSMAGLLCGFHLQQCKCCKDSHSDGSLSANSCTAPHDSLQHLWWMQHMGVFCLRPLIAIKALP